MVAPRGLALATFLIDIGNIWHVAATKSLDKTKSLQKSVCLLLRKPASPSPGGVIRKNVVERGAFYGLRSPASPAPRRLLKAERNTETETESEAGEEVESEAQIPLKVSLIWQLAPERGAWGVERGTWLDILMGAPHALSGVDF